MKKVLTIAGSDCSGGAGIQADLKTIMAHNCYGMSVITALTAQNTSGVYGVIETDKKFVAKQIDCIFSDIIPDSVKIGMVSSSKIIEEIANQLLKFNAQNIVIDPVMVSTSGSKLLNDSAINMLKNKLFPLSLVITPNISEAEVLSDIKIKNKEDMIKSAKEISKFYKGNILIKGGHLKDTADDLLFSQNQIHWFELNRIDNPNTHGTGCTLSSAIACNLAKGQDIHTSILNAKKYITKALKANLNLGKGSGPLWHNV